LVRHIVAVEPMPRHFGVRPPLETQFDPPCPDSSSVESRHLSASNLRLIVENHVQQGTVDFDVTVVINIGAPVASSSPGANDRSQRPGDDRLNDSPGG
jgi:hypothetical protein